MPNVVNTMKQIHEKT